MYIPNSFRFNNRQEIIAFMKQYSFATIITSNDSIPIATQLPFFIDDNSGILVLSSHFAKGNQQVEFIEQNTSLIVFSEPHAYISPSFYERKESVPTWDYIAVHAYGKAKIIEENAAKLKLLEQMINFYDKNYMEQWNNLSDKYKNGMMQGIVAFEIEVQDLQGQKKLSQNKTEKERRHIADHLEASPNSNEQILAHYIKQL